MADDSVNIYYYPNTVTEVHSDTEITVKGGGFIEQGDRIQVFDPHEGRVKGEREVVSCESRPDTIRRIVLNAPVTGIVAGDRKGALVNEGDRPADCLYNLSRCGNGFVIRDNVFHRHRRHGMMIKASGGIIENNRMERLGALGIVIGNDPEWPEGVCPTDVIVRNNMIIGCGYTSKWYSQSPHGAAIQVHTLAKGGHPAQERIVSSITLENNTIINPPGAAIYLGSVEDIQLTGNRIEYTEDFTMPRETGAVIVEDSQDISVNDLTITAANASPTAAVELRGTTPKDKNGVQMVNVRIVPETACPMRLPKP